MSSKVEVNTKIALNAIKSIHGDKYATHKDSLEAIQEIQEECEILIDALQDDIDELNITEEEDDEDE